ncbi:MAG: flagellar protein FlaG [Treponema sp.]|nr:flagellar protein FlaG [Treponema sp.]
MTIQVAGTGNGYSPAELTQERIAVQAKTAETRVVLENAHESEQQNQHKPLPEIMADLEMITVAFSKKLKFEVNHQSNDVTVKVIDPETDKVIKVLPPKELQRLHSRLKETIGFLFDERI